MLRRAVELHYAEGLSCEEVATRLSSGAEAVKKRLQRARSALGRCIRQEMASP